MKYYTVIKKNEVLIYATTWMNLKNAMLSERSQAQKTTYCIIPFLPNLRNTQIYRYRK